MSSALALSWGRCCVAVASRGRPGRSVDRRCGDRGVISTSHAARVQVVLTGCDADAVVSIRVTVTRVAQALMLKALVESDRSGADPCDRQRGDAGRYPNPGLQRGAVVATDGLAKTEQVRRRIDTCATRLLGFVLPFLPQIQPPPGGEDEQNTFSSFSMDFHLVAQLSGERW